MGGGEKDATVRVVNILESVAFSSSFFFNFVVTLERFLTFTSFPRQGLKYLCLMGLTAFAAVVAVAAAILFNTFWSFGVDLLALSALIAIGGDFAFNLGKKRQSV